jgi:hypothetical protein
LQSRCNINPNQTKTMTRFSFPEKKQIPKGKYKAEWTLDSEEAIGKKGMIKSSYDFEFTNKNCPWRGKTGRMVTKTTHRQHDDLARTEYAEVDLRVDINGDGKFSKSESIFKREVRGHKISDNLIDYESTNFDTARSLRKLANEGSLEFTTSSKASMVWSMSMTPNHNEDKTFYLSHFNIMPFRDQGLLDNEMLVPANVS